ncbi:hypothetical protein ACH5RR_018764 [Cinchona calisaya]|uniref:Transcription elongation factor SPT5 n=1 Tax=Cinchona calisaya TaxID=153742 RepID=A0ABD2ZQI9_9GENT
MGRGPGEEGKEKFERREHDEYDDGKKKKRRRSEPDDDDEEEELEEESEYRVGKRRAKRSSALQFFDMEAEVDDEEEDQDDEEADDDFIEDGGVDILDKDDGRQTHYHPLLNFEDHEEEDFEALERRFQERYSKRDEECDEEPTEVEQQALLPSIRDPKLWRVICVNGRERDVALCLMKRYIDKGSHLQIRSAVALDHIKNCIYVEADKEAYVREACKGLHNINAKHISLVPLKEMTAVLSVKPKAVHLYRGAWVRMKKGLYKGDLAKVVGVDNVRRKVAVKLFPQNDLQALANKLDDRGVSKKDDFYSALRSKDGFLLKEVSSSSVNAHCIQPTFDELENFLHTDQIGDADMAILCSLSINEKKGKYFKGDRVIVVKGDLKNLKGWVDKVEEDNIYIKPDAEYHLESIAVSNKELCKYFEPGNHVKIIAGAAEGTTGFVVSLEGHVVNIVSDTSKQLLHVFADNVVEFSEVKTGVNRIGDYEVHNLVLLDDMSFGVIIHIDNETFQVLKGVPGKPVVAMVRPREIRCKLDRIKCGTKDQLNCPLSVNDPVKVVDGQWRGKTGRIVYIYRGYLFIHDPLRPEHAGFMCAKSQSCILVAGVSQATTNRNGEDPNCDYSQQRSYRGYSSMNAGGRYRSAREHDALVGAFIKIRKGVYKGHKGRVKEIKGKTVQVELEAQMRVVPVSLDKITDNMNVSMPSWQASRFGLGSETPVHPSQTPLHPCMAPVTDRVHVGMMAMHDTTWNSSPRMAVAAGLPINWGF